MSDKPPPHPHTEKPLVPNDVAKRRLSQPLNSEEDPPINPLLSDEESTNATISANTTTAAMLADSTGALVAAGVRGAPSTKKSEHGSAELTTGLMSSLDEASGRNPSPPNSNWRTQSSPLNSNDIDLSFSDDDSSEDLSHTDGDALHQNDQIPIDSRSSQLPVAPNTRPRRSSASEIPHRMGPLNFPNVNNNGDQNGSSGTNSDSTFMSPTVSYMQTLLNQRSSNSSSASPSPAGTSAARGQGNSESEILAQIQELQMRLTDIREEELTGEDPNTNNPFSGTNQDGPTESERRVIIVSNRLPYTARKANDGSYNLIASSGGLVSAMEGYQSDVPKLWIGWPGCEVDPSDQEQLKARFAERGCHPVFLQEDQADLYYNGFCNDVLWPLFHYVPLPIVGMDGERKFDFKYWTAYLAANHKFAEAVMQVCEKNDMIWVHDYHLMLLPSLLRKRQCESVIGFFLHTPFPSSEVYRMLPVRREVLLGVLEADLIGFQTYEYARHFLSVCTRILGLETTPKGVQYDGHFTDVGIYPIGIDPIKFKKAFEDPVVQKRISEIQVKFAGKRVLLGVDRLDYIKGVPHKLLAFEALLERYPEWKGKVVLVQVAVPSRTEVEEYKKLSSQTHELVGRINGFFGSVEYNPIVFINQPVAFSDLVALYTVADVAVITPIRDGMNLVSYEYVMCQQANHGVLILSEFAGSAQSLSGAIRVNPWNIEEVAAALDEALSRTTRERELKHWKLHRYVTTHTADYWANSFVSDMAAKEMRVMEYANSASTAHLKVNTDLLPVMKSDKRRLILLEYEGGLCVPHTRVERRVPDETLCKTLAKLSLDELNEVYIFSGRSKKTLETWFGDLTVGLVAEHGCDYKPPGFSDWTQLVEVRDNSWQQDVLPIMQYFTERTPGSFLEVKDKVITWHYMDSDPQFGSWQGKELRAHLAESCSGLPVEVTTTHKIVEVRPVGVSRVAVVRRLVQELSSPDVGLIFALGGSEKIDEELYMFLEMDMRSRENLLSPPPERSTGFPPSGLNGSNASLQGLVSNGSENSVSPDFYLSPLIKVVTCRVGLPSSSSAKFMVPDTERAVQVLRETASTVKGTVRARLKASTRNRARSQSIDNLDIVRGMRRGVSVGSSLANTNRQIM